MESTQLESLKPRRDVTNFIKMRAALPADDLAIAELLEQTFLTTYAKKLPSLTTTEERKKELRAVGSRRKLGHVAVAELGYRIIGTFSLTHPESSGEGAWRPNSSGLRCVAIDPDFHGLQLSELLLSEADRIALAWSAESICLHVQKEAEKVAQLYLQHGYIRDTTGDRNFFGTEIQGYYKPLITQH